MIDLLVPYYGPEALLRETVQSVLDQTSPDWRLVVVDDLYPDADIEPWLQSLADRRIHYVRNKSNLGVSANFQRCLELAEAEHIVFLGCDDRLLPAYVELVGDAVRDAPATMVQPQVAVIDEHGQPARSLTDQVKSRLAPSVDGRLRCRGEDLATSLMRGAWTYFPAICWEREAVLRHGFRTDRALALDVGLIIDLLVDGGDLLLLEEVAFEYRRHPASASVAAAHSTARFADERAFFRQMSAQLDAHGWNRAARAARRHSTSRLHAATLLPTAAARLDVTALRDLGRHLVARG